jgi:hypothetical protein
MEIKALLFWYRSRGSALSEDWLCRVPLGLLRLRLVMTLRLVFARFGTNRSNLLWVQEVHLCITCNRLPNILGQNLWFINPYNSGDNPIPEHKQEVLLQISYRLTR